LRLGKLAFENVVFKHPLVPFWPLQIGLELATRALLDPGDRSSVDFSRPAGEPALVSPDSVSWRVFKNPDGRICGCEQETQMKIIVVGATGTIGSKVVEALLNSS
jgi:hypothetical protein